MKKSLICTTQDGPNPRGKLKTSKPHNILHESIFQLSSLNRDTAQPGVQDIEQPVIAARTREAVGLGFHSCFQGCLKTTRVLQGTQLEQQPCPLRKPDPGGQGKESFLLTVLLAPSMFSCQMQSKLGGLESAFAQRTP